MELKFLMILLLFLLSLFFLSRGRKSPGRLPPGSLGLPLIGQSFGLIKALKSDKLEEWFKERIARFGPIWKARLFGYPTIILHGSSANKFVYTCDSSALTNKQPPSIRRILGSRNIQELTGDDHKRVRMALVSFLKPEVLKQYIAKVDDEIQNHFEMYWHGKNEVQVLPFFKTLTFNVICSLLFDIEKGPKREQLLPLFQNMMKSILAVPINFPFTKYNHGLKARKELVTRLLDLLHEKKEVSREQQQQQQQQQQVTNHHKDLITTLLGIGYDDNSAKMSDEEIFDNIIIVMFAGYDTTAILLTFLVRLLANNKSIYSNIAREQEEISKSKAPGEALTWKDLTNMKYTWRVAYEALRINPPVNLTFRRAAQDIEYEGYIIPKGWQVILSACMTHMDDNIFQNPTMFDPTRFEIDAPSPPSYSFVAFGGGPRMCPGMEFAKMETLVMIHRLVTQFTWELVNKEDSFKRIKMIESGKCLSIQIKPIE